MKKILVAIDGIFKLNPILPAIANGEVPAGIGLADAHITVVYDRDGFQVFYAGQAAGRTHGKGQTRSSRPWPEDREMRHAIPPEFDLPIVQHDALPHPSRAYHMQAGLRGRSANAHILTERQSYEASP